MADASCSARTPPVLSATPALRGPRVEHQPDETKRAQYAVPGTEHQRGSQGEQDKPAVHRMAD